MAAKYILALGAMVFLAAAGNRMIRTRQAQGAARTWLLMALIFAVVSTWLFMEN